MEKWRKYNEDYEVSELGRIRSIKRRVRCNTGETWVKPKILKLRARKDGRLDVTIQRQGQKLIHRLVATIFIPNPKNLPQVNHKDGNPLNNKVSNLEWVTRTENLKHSYQIGLRNQRGEKNGNVKINNELVWKIRALANNYTHSQLAIMFNKSYYNIRDIVLRKTWNHI